jgi:hypothetical protein
MVFFKIRHAVDGTVNSIGAKDLNILLNLCPRIPSLDKDKG